VRRLACRCRGHETTALGRSPPSPETREVVVRRLACRIDAEVVEQDRLGGAAGEPPQLGEYVLHPSVAKSKDEAGAKAPEVV
jgi:hypothetical protein